MIKINPYSNYPLPLYNYFIGTYAKFLLSGKCLSFPRVIQIQTQSRCNAQCSICPYRTTSKVLDHGVMEWELFSKISDELISEKKSPMFMFALHNEPLIDKRIFDWVKHVKSKNPECYCIVPTNGELLDTFTLGEIKQSGVSQLNINLGAHSKETYERIHTGLDYERVIKNVNRLIDDETLKPKLQIMFVLNKEKAHEVQQALSYWKQQGVRTKVIRLTNRAGALDTYERFNLKNDHYAGTSLLRGWKNLMSNTRRSIGCELPFYQMDILFNGDVIICSLDWKRSIVIGNVKTSSLRLIWNSERINEIRKLIFRKRYTQINSCKECSLVK